jgi:GAF domain-containing protein
MQFSPDAPDRDSRRPNARLEGAVLDTRSEGPFDCLLRLAAEVLRVPVSLLMLVDGEREFFRSSTGLPPPHSAGGEIPPVHGLQRRVVASGEPLFIPDARKHHRGQHDPETNVIAYAGVPLRGVEDQVLGVLAVIDHVPRAWTPRESCILADLAGLALRELDQRTELRTTAPDREMQVVSGHFRQLVEH